MKAIIIMAGTTGAGKTTHGKILAARVGAHYISSGDIARSLMDAQTNAAFKEGQLSPHEDAIRAEIKMRMEYNDLVVLDGFPRLMDQMRWLMGMSSPTPIYTVQLEWAERVLVDRWANRGRDPYDTLRACILRDDLYHKETASMFGEPRYLCSSKVDVDVMTVAMGIHSHVIEWLKSINYSINIIKGTRQMLIDRFISDYHISKWESGRMQTTWVATREEVEAKLWEIVNV